MIWVYMVIEWIGCFIENMLGILFVEGILGIETTKAWKRVLAALVVSIGLWLINQLSLFSVYATAFGIVALTVSVWILNRSGIMDTLVAVMTFLFGLHVYNVVVMMVGSVLTGSSSFGSELVSGYSFERSVTILLSMAVLCVIYLLFRKRVIPVLDIKQRKLAAGLALSLGLAIWMEGSVNSHYDTEEGLLYGSLVAVMVGLMGYTCYQYVKLHEKDQERKLLEERNRTIMSGYAELRKNYEEMAVFRHDMKNHMILLENCILKGEKEKAEDYIEELMKKLKGIGAGRWTGNEEIDFLLNYKKSEAEKSKIHMKIESGRIELGKETEGDVATLIGNLLDNAIEGSNKEHGEKKILMRIRRSGNMLFIKTENHCKIKPEEVGGIPVTTKEDKKLHGWGYRSMKLIAEKYAGRIRSEWRDGIYSVTVSLYDVGQN